MFRAGSPFVSRLRGTTFANSSYDRYTFYRMLAQLSTDSASELPFANIAQLQTKIGASNRLDYIAEPAGKINLNFNNLDYPITDMVPWSTPVPSGGLMVAGGDRFFNAVADVLLRSQFPFGVSNIYVTNYNVTVHRLLQVAANIHETLHHHTNVYPAIFRPKVVRDTLQPGQPFMISGYYQDNDYLSAIAWLPTSASMPMVVGAKKGFPNFNEYVAETIISAVRKLELVRQNTNSSPYQTNEMFIIGIGHRYSLEAWNSYMSRYTNAQIAIANNVTISITNTDGFVYFTNRTFSTNFGYAQWPGFVGSGLDSRNAASFKVPMYDDGITLSNGIYRAGSPGTIESLGDTNYFIPNSGFHAPDWNLTISNDLVFVLLSGNTMIDFVHLSLTNSLGLITNFFSPGQRLSESSGAAKCWDTNRFGSAPMAPTEGVKQQIAISLGSPTVGAADWQNFANVGDSKTAIDSFKGFMFPQLNQANNSTNLVHHAPYTPARKMVIAATWEVNDPLVHYMEDHLKGETNNYSREPVLPFAPKTDYTNKTIGVLNKLYRPWGGRLGHSSAGYDANMLLKDSGVRKSDDWDFPTNQVPTIGWLGRIHRGTAWQTIYLKAGMAPLSDWRKFSLDPWSHPTNDWRLIDVFTTAIHPNASHGQLSVNQTNFAAWSALLSGVIALDSVTPEADILDGKPYSYQPKVIQPSSQELLTIYEAIQKRREQMPDKVFRRLGDLLSVPELTFGFTNSPQPTYSPYVTPAAMGLIESPTDQVYERIPQQILSLLKVGDPRYVVYAWGQSLRPAENSIISSGSYMGMCTNYQVTGEFVTRTVFQIEGTAGQPRPTVKAFNILSSD